MRALFIKLSLFLPLLYKYYVMLIKNFSFAFTLIINKIESITYIKTAFISKIWIIGTVAYTQIELVVATMIFIAVVAQPGTAQAWKTGKYHTACFRKDFPVQNRRRRFCSKISDFRCMKVRATAFLFQFNAVWP